MFYLVSVRIHFPHIHLFDQYGCYCTCYLKKYHIQLNYHIQEKFREKQNEIKNSKLDKIKRSIQKK